MEIFGGFMVMMSIISLFLAIVWLIMPFVVFAIKGKQDRTLDVLETIEKRLAVIENAYMTGGRAPAYADVAGQTDCVAEPSVASSTECAKMRSESAPDKQDPEVSPEV